MYFQLHVGFRSALFLVLCDSGPDFEEGGRDVGMESEIHRSSGGSQELICVQKGVKDLAGAGQVGVVEALTQHVFVQPTQYKVVLAVVGEKYAELTGLFSSRSRMPCLQSSDKSEFAQLH